jgi:hypothetical protein
MYDDVCNMRGIADDDGDNDDYQCMMMYVI